LILANQLGAVVFTIKGEHAVEALLDFARRYRVGNVIVGKPQARRRFPWLRGRSVVDSLLQVPGLSVQVVDTSEPDAAKAAVPAPSGLERGGELVDLLPPEHIVVLTEAVGRKQLIRILTRIALKGTGVNAIAASDAVIEREGKGSTFLNSGLALPHAFVEGLHVPCLALGLPKGGILDALDDPNPDAVFVLLTPVHAEALHLELLSAIGRAFQDTAVRDSLAAAVGPEDAIAALRGAAPIRPSSPSPPRP
jgi:mannitol/fructose-specific phosphotransferase system IIA component (Ntr-type)